MLVAVLADKQVKEEAEEVESAEGDGGDRDGGEILFGLRGIFMVGGGLESITSLSWTWLNFPYSSSLESVDFLGLHLLMQEPIWRIFLV